MKKTAKAGLCFSFIFFGAIACATQASSVPPGQDPPSAERESASPVPGPFVRPRPCVPLPAHAPFPKKSDGAAYRALVRLTVGADGKAKDVCLVRAEGDEKWEARAFGDLAEWTYPPKYAGQQRERLVSFRLTPP